MAETTLAVYPEVKKQDVLAEMAKKIKDLQDENLKLKTSGTRPVTFKVSEKGAVSIYGINSRFPVTLYGEQWLKLLALADSLKSFINENKAILATKQIKLVK